MARWISLVRQVGRMLEAEKQVAAGIIPVGYMEEVLEAVAARGMQLLIDSGKRRKENPTPFPLIMHRPYEGGVPFPGGWRWLWRL